MTDWGALYRSNVDAVCALGEGLSEEQLATTVPGTPAWIAHDVYAHLAGGPADALAGRTEGAPGPGWTAQHVGERQGLPLAELLRELQSNVESTAATLVDKPSPGALFDIAVHHADLHEAFGLGVLPERFWAPIVTLLGPQLLGGLPVTMTATSGASASETYGAGGPAVEVAAYEVFRALFSRRSRAQVRVWGVEASQEQLDAIFVFGPREDDQPIPA